MMFFNTPKQLKIPLTLLMLLLSLGLWGEHIPSVSEVPLGAGGRLAVNYDLGDLDLFAEAGARWEYDHPLRRFATLGALYRILPNLKAGVFYQLDSGVRHDDDWVSDGLDRWWWKDPSDRWENTLIAEISPRFLLDFLPGDSWVINLRTRYDWNLTNLQQTFILRPELTWFWMVDREPLANFSLAYGLYMPVNYSSALFYKQAPYLNTIFHLSENIKLENRLSYEMTTWTESEDNKALDQSFQVTNGVLSWDMGILLFF